MNLLDIADAEVALSRDGHVLYREPGVALVEGREVLFGHAALAQSRLRPRQLHNAFWQRLNADPVTPAGRSVANQADLVYLHLLEIRAALGDSASPAEVIVAVPPTATAAHLSLLLGIASEAGFKIRAFVDAAVAAASALRLPGPCRVVDLGLHRATVTGLTLATDEPDGPQLRRGQAAEVPAAGLVAMMEGWIDAVADRFVESTRFDPLRVAATDQQLFQQLFDQIGAGVARQVAEFTIEVRHGDISHRVSVDPRAFAEKAEQRYGLLADAIGAPDTLVLTHRALRPPGLAAHLEAAGHRLLRLPENALPQALARQSERLLSPDESVRLATSLPVPSPEEQQSAPEAPPPTHLLCGAIALPLADETSAADHPAANGERGFRVRRRGGGFAIVPTTGDVRLNGERIEFEQAVGSGDVIRHDGLEFRLIAVLDGAPAGSA